MRISLYTTLTAEECAQRITASVDPMTMWSRMGLAYFKPVLGHIRGSALTLEKRPYLGGSQIPARSWYPALFRGTLVAEEGGTRIEGTLAVSPAVETLMGLWLGAALILGGLAWAVGISQLVSGEAGGWSHCLPLSIPAILLLLGLGLRYEGRRKAEVDSRYLAAFLRSTLQAEVMEDGPGVRT